ncbi:SDR family NAD(P)-dependent oxidoreductase [Candidatus Binatia bacterium]|nr:SDR family NAD(P)-dependent oxidoreductase [Candidatus Binatia bacterium]
MSKVAIITGASSGIGRALAFELARRGWWLGLCARRGDVLETIRGEIESGTPGARVETAILDVNDTAAVREAIPELASRFGKVDLLVANAGIGGERFAGDDRFALDEAIIRTNLLGAMATVDAGVKLFRASGGGHIVGVTSVAGFRGLPGHGAYSASKAGLSTYLEAVRAEVERDGITVTTLAPGYIDTPINSHMKSRPFLVTAEKGAERAADLIERGVRSAPVPVFPWNAVGLLMRNLPDFLWYRVMQTQLPRRQDAGARRRT